MVTALICPRLTANHGNCFRPERCACRPTSGDQPDRGSPEPQSDKPILEIRQLFLDAIDAAESLIYIENQYCSSEALSDALIDRMRQHRRGRLEIVLVIAKDAEAFLEQLSIAIAQSQIISRLKEVAAETGHSFGIYYPVSIAADGTDLPTYIHSKLLLIDDRFLSIGSANMNNRSMGYDTELNVSWDDVPGSSA